MVLRACNDFRSVHSKSLELVRAGFKLGLELKTGGFFRIPESGWSKKGCKAEGLVPVSESPRTKSFPESGVWHINQDPRKVLGELPLASFE